MTRCNLKLIVPDTEDLPCTKEKFLHGLTQNIPMDTLRVLAKDMISAVLEVVTDLQVCHEEIFDDCAQPFEEIFKTTQLQDVKDYIKAAVLNTAVQSGKKQKRKVSKVVQDIQTYLLNNISDYELSLRKVAKEFYLNPSYLSRMFKQETGKSFVEYLTNLRVEKALSLLQKSDIRVYELAEEVGIADPHYLGVCFKKYLGVSITDYKKRMIPGQGLQKKNLE